jgi:DNA-binding protein H-NS
MARSSYATQKTRLEKEKAKIEKQLQSLQAKQRKPVITSIVRSMRDYGITPEEILAAFDRKKNQQTHHQRFPQASRQRQARCTAQISPP